MGCYVRKKNSFFHFNSLFFALRQDRGGYLCTDTTFLHFLIVIELVSEYEAFAFQYYTV